MLLSEIEHMYHLACEFFLREGDENALAEATNCAAWARRYELQTKSITKQCVWHGRWTRWSGLAERFRR